MKHTFNSTTIRLVMHRPHCTDAGGCQGAARGARPSAAERRQCLPAGQHGHHRAAGSLPEGARAGVEWQGRRRTSLRLLACIWSSSTAWGVLCAMLLPSASCGATARALMQSPLPCRAMMKSSTGSWPLGLPCAPHPCLALQPLPQLQPPVEPPQPHSRRHRPQHPQGCSLWRRRACCAVQCTSAMRRCCGG